MRSTYITEIFRDNPNKGEVENIVISLLETSDNLTARFASIKAIENFRIKSREIYEVIENLAISDENPLIRSEAVRLIIRYFLDDGINLLKYLIENEKTLMIIKRFRNELKTMDCQTSNTLYKYFINRYANIYSLIPKEVEFIIDLECMKEDDSIGFFKPQINNHHIIKLDLAGRNLNKIPDSVGNLHYLKCLSLWNNRLTFLPKSFESLIGLEELYLDWNNFTTIPEIDWSKLKSLKKLNLTNNPNLRIEKCPNNQSLIQNLSKNYLKEGVCQNEVSALVFLEIVTGQRIEKVHDNQPLNKLYACNYKLNDAGYIIGLYLYGYYGFQIKRIPDEIFSLKYLKELIIRDQQVENLPDIINNLMYLEKLDLSGNNLRILPKTIKKLKRIKFLDLEGNMIKEIPRSILNSEIDLWL